MNKTGFTLIELIAVIVILGFLALLVFPSILAIIEDSKESAYQAQGKKITEGAEKYFIDNPDELPEMDEAELQNCIDVLTLIEHGYIAADDVKDPRNMRNSLGGVVRVTYKNNKYLYSYDEFTSSCG